MFNFKPLPSKEAKRIRGYLEDQWGCTLDKDYIFFKNQKDRLYIVNRDFAKLSLDRLRVSSIGMYFGEIMPEGLRLSIDASQMVGIKAKKQIVEINDDQKKEWMYGQDITHKGQTEGYVLIKWGNDILGCGKQKGDKILNYVPKERRMTI